MQVQYVGLPLSLSEAFTTTHNVYLTAFRNLGRLARGGVDGLALRICCALCQMLALAFLVWSSAATAQFASMTTSSILTPQGFQSIDRNGVDLLTGRLNIKGPVLSMGSGPQAAIHAYNWTGETWTLNVPQLSFDKDWAVWFYDGETQVKFAEGVKGTTDNAWGWPAQTSAGQRYDYKPLTGGTSASLFCYFTGGVSGQGWVDYCQYHGHQGRFIEWQGWSPVSGGYPPGQEHGHDEFGNGMGWPIRVQEPAKGLNEEYTNTAFNRVWPAGFKVNRTSTVDRKTQTVTMTNLNSSGAAKTLVINTPNLSSSDHTNAYLRPKSVTQTWTDAAGKIWSYTFNSNRDITSFVTPDGVTATIGYDGSHRVTSYNDGAGTWTYSYSFSDGSSGPGTTTATDPNFKTKQVSHVKKPGPATSVTDEMSRTTGYTYDSFDRLTSITYPSGYSTTYTYDTRGNITQILTAKPGSGQADITQSATYDATCPLNAWACNKPRTLTDGRNNTTSFDYATNGLLNSVTSPAVLVNGVSQQPQIRYTYSALTTPYIGTTGTANFLALSTISQCRTTASCTGTPDETRTTIGYGAAAQNFLPVAISSGPGSNPTLSTVNTGYDNFGDAVTIQDPLGNATYSFFDANRRPTGTISPDPDGSGPLLRRATRTTYRADGQAAKVEQGTTAGVSAGDLAGMTVLQQITTDYDVVGRKSQDSLQAGGTTYSFSQYSYDALSQLECIAERMNSSAFGSTASACDQGPAGTFGQDRIQKNSYNFAGQITKQTTGYGTSSPNLQRDEATYNYDSFGRLQSLADAKGNLTSFTYDAFDRLAQTRFPNLSGGGSSSSDYEELSYDANSNVVGRRIRNGQSIAYVYDAINRLTGKNLPTGTSNANPILGYDLVGNLLTANSANGSFSTGTSFTWDVAGNKLSEAGSFNGAGTATKSFQYDAAGRLTRLTWPDGFYVTYEYDALGEMTWIRQSDGSAIANYTYDDLGRRQSRINGNGTSAVYGYDAVSRLTSLSLSGSTGNTITLGDYSPAGEIGFRTISNDAYIANPAPVSNNYSTDGLNRYAAINGAAVGYDAKSNISNLAGASYTFNSENVLASGGGSTFRMDAFNRLIFSSSTGVRFDYDGDRLVSIYDATNNLIRRYVHGPGVDEPVLWYEQGLTDKRYMESDERGSIIRVTNAAGGLIRINSYDDRGVPSSNNLGRFQYTGQIWLPEIGSYNYKARIYAPGIGRFMQPDPIGYASGLNLYSYVGENPANRTDPTGLVYGPTPGWGGGGCVAECNATGYFPANGGDIVVTANSSSFWKSLGFGGGSRDLASTTGAFGVGQAGYFGLPGATATGPRSGHSASATLAVAAGVLVADDVTVVGIADDPLAAVLGVAAVGALAVESLPAIQIHGNSSQSPRSTEVYNLINRSTGAIDKIGITSNPAGRYSQAYLAANNVRYQTVERYSSRYPAIVHENISLTWYRITHGNYPRLNRLAR